MDNHNGQPCSIKLHQPQRTTMMDRGGNYCRCQSQCILDLPKAETTTHHGTHDRVAMAQLQKWLQFAINGIDAMVAVLAMVNEGNGAIVAMVAMGADFHTRRMQPLLRGAPPHKKVILRNASGIQNSKQPFFVYEYNHRHCHGWKWVTTNAHANNML